jgi:hypothetical protein
MKNLKTILKEASQLHKSSAHSKSSSDRKFNEWYKSKQLNILAVSNRSYIIYGFMIGVAFMLVVFWLATNF